MTHSNEHQNGKYNYLDLEFDIETINELSHYERSTFKPVYTMNKWWARRSSSVFRAILLGISLPPGIDLKKEFYSNNQANSYIKDKIILDPFMGGGTTVVEALRLGYRVIGFDINPLAWFIVKNETTRVDLEALKASFAKLDTEVSSKIQAMYRTCCPCCLKDASLVYTFWAKIAPCTDQNCQHQVPLLRDYLVGKRRGEVPVNYFEIECKSCKTSIDIELDKVDLTHHSSIRLSGCCEATQRAWIYWDQESTIQCQSCQEELPLKSSNTISEAKVLTKKIQIHALLCSNCWFVFSHRGEIPEKLTCPSCDHCYNPHQGSTSNGSFVCPEGHTSKITDAVLKKGGNPLEFRMYALEGYCPSCAKKTHRETLEDLVLFDSVKGLKKQVCACCKKANHKFYKAPNEKDLKRYQEAETDWQRLKDELVWPKGEIQNYEKTNRLIIHGYTHWHQLFNVRQLLALSYILKSILTEPQQDLKEALISAFLGTLEHQNMLNIYYVPYAQSAGAFGRHDFHPKVMVCEGNPWGAEKGRGTLVQVFKSILEGKGYLLNPFDAKYSNGKRELIYSKEEFQGKVADNFEELCRGLKNLLLRASDSKDLSSLPSSSVDDIVTDPPYADSIQYSELSDFFYVWLREALKTDYPNIFKEEEAPKKDEIVQNLRRAKTQKDFYGELGQSFRECNRVLKPNGRLVFTFHHSKKSQWTFLFDALHQAGFELVAVYPIQSEGTRSGNLVFHSNKKSISYDIIHVCRKALSTQNEHRIISWSELEEEVTGKVRFHIQKIFTGNNYGHLKHADVQIMLWSQCLSTYYQYYGRVLDEYNNSVELVSALDRIDGFIENLMIRDNI